MDWENVKILDFESKYHKRLISEIRIKEQKNGLKLNKNTELLDLFYLITLPRTHKYYSLYSLLLFL